MGINIGICELEAENAPCRALKTKIVRVHMADISGFEGAAAFDEIVSLDEAKKLFPDWDDFMKRNRLNAEVDAVYMDKVKKADDEAKLRPLVKKVYTGWVDAEKVPSVDDAVAKSDGNVVTGWDMLDFDQMNEMCGKCPLSWDKGRGCIGAFGPDNSLLPEIAAKYGCKIIASAPESSKTQRKFEPECATRLATEVETLTKALPEEGKMMVRRYSGPLERLGAVAKISADEKCGFFFF